jgi:anti-anti-sigma factor
VALAMSSGELPNGQCFSADVDVATSKVRVRGELDAHSVGLLCESIDILVRSGCYDISVDVTDLFSIDAAGVKLLIALQHSLSTQCGGLTILNAPPSVVAALRDGQVAARPRLIHASQRAGSFVKERQAS